MAESQKQANTKIADLDRDTVTAGKHTTSDQGVLVSDDQNSLKAGPRGPVLLEDFLMREKIMHFDHERIPERIVHARGSGAHGYFQVYKDMSAYSKAAVFRNPSHKTPVFVRFSTVQGSRGSTDMARDVRGFATKFYTEEGVWDLVGNNIPVFFIQDAIQFPDLVHAVKPEQDNEIPQAASAHDTFWDFVSLTPETAHMLMWVMSDRALPRSFSMMEGFGVNTYRLINAEGVSHFVKFHWKPIKGVFSHLWDETQRLAGRDADYQRRDMWEAIERGDFFEYELGFQLVTEEQAATLPFDILDDTKLIPEELIPVMPVGRMVLNRNPANFFCETEQVAYCVSHLVPGIDLSDDPMLTGRAFSYLDTQISRLGVNFTELPINRPVCPVSNNERDGRMRHRIDKGKANYFPNSIGGGCPMHSPEAMAAFRSCPQQVNGRKVRERSETFKDHYSQATMFWNSMSEWERNHIVEAFSFEINHCVTDAIRQRVLDVILVNIADELAERVAVNTGLKISAKRTGKPNTDASPALSQNKPALSLKGRQLAVPIADGTDAAQVKAIRAYFEPQGVVVSTIALRAGTVNGKGGAIPVDNAAPNAPSVLFDAVIVPGGTPEAAAALQTGIVVHFLQEAFLHQKPIAAFGGAAEVLQRLNLAQAEGVLVADDANDRLFKEFTQAMLQHRFYKRKVDHIPA